MNTIPKEPVAIERSLRRSEAAKYVVKTYGLPCSAKTLAKWACISSEGPPFRLAGRFPLYLSHICERRISSNECVECNRLRQQRKKARNPERVRLCNRLSKQKQRARDPERVRQQWREWYARQKAKETAAPA